MTRKAESDPRDILLLHSKYVKQKQYWYKKLSGEYDLTSLHFELSHEENNSNLYKKTSDKTLELIELHIPYDISKQLVRMSKDSDISLYILLLTALNVIVYRYTTNKNIIILSPVNQLAATDETINNIVLIRNTIESNLTFKEIVLKIRETVLEAYNNQDYPFDKIVESKSLNSEDEIDTPEKELSHITTIECLLKNIHSTDLYNQKLSHNDIDLSVQFEKDGEQIKQKLLYDQTVYKKNEIDQFSNHFINVLSQVVENVNLKISEIIFLQEQEKKQLLHDFNNNKNTSPQEKTINQFISENAQRTPHHYAIGYDEELITYKQLEKDSTHLGKILRKNRINSDHPAGILLDRSPSMIIIILAIWEAGGGYIPMDTEYPVQRILEILEDSNSQILITNRNQIVPKLETSFSGTILVLDEIIKTDVEKNEEESSYRHQMNNISYIIYTSGSTGRPKGVMVEHIGMMNHISAKINDLKITNNSIIAQNSSHTFDISVWQFFTALIKGGRTIIYPNEIVFEPSIFISKLINHQISILEVVPSYLTVMLEIVSENPQTFNFMNFLLVTGEEVKASIVSQWFSQYPGIKLVNAYGPTEASDDITHMVMETVPKGNRIPIGKPILNMNIYIVDDHMNLCPIGVKGEICVSGIGVGRGYLNDQFKTQKSFCLDPFKPEEKLRLYKTGDLGRWLADGTIEFFGRIDHQVKIRGFRIELGEIEAQLSAHSAVKENAVVIKKNNDQFICAFIVPTLNEKTDIAPIKNFLKEKLPYYMIPDYFVMLEKMPLTSNGKIDRNALSKLDINFSSNIQFIAPRTPIEETLAQIWAELLGIKKESIGVHFDFFELGGQSLKATILTQRIFKIFNINIPVGEIFNNPTIEGIASFISVSDWLNKPDTNLNQQESEEIVI